MCCSWEHLEGLGGHQCCPLTSTVLLFVGEVDRARSGWTPHVRADTWEVVPVSERGELPGALSLSGVPQPWSLGQVTVLPPLLVPALHLGFTLCFFSPMLKPRGQGTPLLQSGPEHSAMPPALWPLWELEGNTRKCLQKSKCGWRATVFLVGTQAGGSRGGTWFFQAFSRHDQT